MASKTQAELNAAKKRDIDRASFSSLKEIINTIDLERPNTRTYSTYSRDNLRTYLRNPASDANQKNLRKLSEYLYTVSHVYRRIIKNKANQNTCKNWIAWPKVNESGEIEESTYKNCQIVNRFVENMRLHSQVNKIWTKAWLDDVVYGFCYGDPDDGTFFIQILDPDYCRISSQNYYSGKLNFAFDFTFFQGSNSFYLDAFDPIFKKMNNIYENGGARWQELPSERTICFKVNDDNLDFPIPPFSGMFDSLISLSDLQQIQDAKDELSAYKLIWAKIDTVDGSKQINDFEIDLELANQFYQKIQTALPENVAIALSPMDLDSIDFQSNSAEDTNIINKAYQNLVEANGDIVSNSNKITNSTSFKLALMADSMHAMQLVNQLNTWINFYIQQNLKIEDVEVEFSDVSKYFEEDRINLLLKLAQYGIPIKTELASLLGLNPAKCRSMEYIEEKLGLSKTVWAAPLVSSNVQSSVSDDDKPLSDEGERTKDGEKNDI